jgi:hypothetical protein
MLLAGSRPLPPPPFAHGGGGDFDTQGECGSRSSCSPGGVGAATDQTEKIETEVEDVDRIRAYRCTQLCPGCPSEASHSHNIIYYFHPADSPPSRIIPRWRVLYWITRQLLHCVRYGSFSHKLRQLTPVS